MDNETESTVAPKERRWVLFWGVAIILFELIVGGWICVLMWQDKVNENARIEAIILSPTAKLGAQYDEAAPPGISSTPQDVKTGVYIIQIPSMNMGELHWTADFDLWFEWQGDAIDPGESFRILDGTILSSEKVAEVHEGNNHYARYHVVADVYKYLDVPRFPLSEIILTLVVKDAVHPVYELRHIADATNSAVGSRVHVISGIEISKTAAITKLLPYQTNLGDPTLPADYKPTFSSFIFGIWLTSPGWSYFLKLFLPLFISVLISISVFFIKPTDVDPRFGLGIGGLFAASANSYIISSLIPPSGSMSLADMINILGLATIFLTLVESIVSLYLYDIKGKQALSRMLDKVSIYAFLSGYIVVNIAIPLVARS